MASITDPEVHSFLTEGTRTVKFAYLSPAGRPLVAPVWYIVEGEDLIFNTGKDTIKGRYLAHDRRVTLCVDLEKEPYGFVQIQGQAGLSDDPANCCGRRPRSPRVTWAPTVRRSSGTVTGCPVSWLSASAQPRCWFTST